jgi:acyl-CoA synthetase (AMP-forming)/AMP-acid ligase II
MTLAYAVHRLDGLVSPANAAYSASELEFQLKNSGAKALFTVRQAIPNSVYKPANACQKCMPLLETSLQAAKGAGISNNRIYILEMPKEFYGDKSVPFKTVGQLIAEGEKLPQLSKQKWGKGQGARQTAYLCYSSGTSGLPVSTAISLEQIR